MAKRHESKQIVAVATKAHAQALLKQKGRELAEALSQAIPEGNGYVLILTDPQGVVFFTDATKEQAIASLREVLAHLTDKRSD